MPYLDTRRTFLATPFPVPVIRISRSGLPVHPMPIGDRVFWPTNKKCGPIVLAHGFNQREKGAQRFPNAGSRLR